ncbi:MAG: CBS and ACT domain-containing protein [Desulfomonile sp.]|nr:CBS and ACT domain-containing protein [Desulfomonile sp.]
MLVKDWMTDDVAAVDVNDTVHRLVVLMMDHKLGIVPVLEDGKLVGVVTEEDLRRAAPIDTSLPDIPHIVYHLSNVHVGSIMTRAPLTVRPDYTLEEAAAILLRHKVSGCPVLDNDDALVGVITKDDLFKAMVSLSGLVRKGIQFGFLIEDKPGSIQQVVDTLRRRHARLVSIVCPYENAPPGYRYLYVRVFNIDRENLPGLKEELKEKGKLIYIVDHRENTREIYPE